MIGKVSAATVRHQHGVLILSVLLAVGNAAATAFAPSLAQLLFLPLVVLALVLLVLGLLSLQNRPAYFEVQPQIPAFGTPAPAWRACLAACFLLPASAEVGALIPSSKQDNPWTPDSILDISWPLLIALLLAEAWRGYGVQLRPHGVQQSWILGSLTVPWEALPVAQTTLPAERAAALWLAYAEPQLVRRRGIPWRRHALRTDNVDPRFLAAAIHHYVRHPDHRAAIGSHAEYQRLLAELPGRHGGNQPNGNL
ncbi:hypothetical protein GCE86_05780 [Micromonospora terminaliae]|uniref:Uncharacterized protein n=1 Tax=Micromonospora terminaliae TaxID=1914461 RepID=A0AAJ3DLT8_9ACTN|nr:hypothetical protein [Micromonospora terminaliae]NES31234.1 hypothetical protein [Micromonospora terminaliae]QGL46602.1 hypothetical protein GCE86_05780 [Micromonospora terminaliae]